MTKRDPVHFKYAFYSKNPLPRNCIFRIKYSAENTPPKRADDEVSDLCQVHCEWDKPFEDWTPVGTPKDGWRRHDDLSLAMRFEGEPIWKLCVGSRQQEQDVNVQYS